MAKRRINKSKNKIIENKGKTFLYKDLGDGYELKYRIKSNGLGGYHDVDMELLKDKETVKKITDEYGGFIDFPGVLNGPWMDKLVGGYEPYVNFAASIYKFKYGFSLFSWTVQPDGRYYEDETGFGAERDEEVVLYSYMNKKGEFVTPFSEFQYNRQIESFEAFKERTHGFSRDSMPSGHELWVSSSAKKKVDLYGKYKPFFGNTVVFPLEKEMCDYLDSIQSRLGIIRKQFEYNQPEAYLANALDKDTYHITLHDLFYGEDKSEVENRYKASEKQVLNIIHKIREMDFPSIFVEPVYLYNMNSTSIVLGFQAIDEKNHENLMMLYELFQPVVQLKEYTPHATLSYFRYGHHKNEKLNSIRELIKEVNQEIKTKKMVVELDVKKISYQYFESMNHYREGGTSL